MERITKKQPDLTYALADDRSAEEAIRQLGRYEDMYEALCAERARIISDMGKLHQAGKSNTVTGKQLLANKLMLMNLIGRFDIYGEP